MAKNEDGEFELILGNRQLISIFLIVVILLGVFFSMGYIVGRNSAPSPQLSAMRDQPSGTTSQPGARPQPASGSPPVQSTPASQSDAPKDEGAHNPPATEPQAAQTPAAKPEPPAPVPTSTAEPAPGEIYLQVTSVKPDVAETVARTLKDKGFPAVLSPGPAGKTRVLVGPYTDLAKLGQAKAELERLGFSPFVKR